GLGPPRRLHRLQGAARADGLTQGMTRSVTRSTNTSRLHNRSSNFKEGSAIVGVHEILHRGRVYRVGAVSDSPNSRIWTHSSPGLLPVTRIRPYRASIGSGSVTSRTGFPSVSAIWLQEFPSAESSSTPA